MATRLQQRKGIALALSMPFYGTDGSPESEGDYTHRCSHMSHYGSERIRSHDEIEEDRLRDARVEEGLNLREKL